MKILPINNSNRKYIALNGTKDSINSNLQPQDNNNKQYRKNLLLCGMGVSVGIGGVVFLANSSKVSKFAKAELLNICKNSNVENYKASVENMQNGTFNLDLHSHSCHSDGWGQVPNLLDEISEYANRVYEKTGKKFTFALTDHDRISGTKEALDIIKSNPEKYKNINFVPGVELSFVFNSEGNVKAGEILVYFANPESPKIKSLVDGVNDNRSKMIEDGIKKLGDGFSRSDMNNYFLNSNNNETFAYFLHYRLFNYAQIKNRVNKMAKEQNCNPDDLYRLLMEGYVFNNGGTVLKPFVSPEGFDKYIKSIGLKTNTEIIDNNITETLSEFFPKIQDGKVVSQTENSFEKIIDTLRDENDVVIGFAHPYFTAVQMQDFRKEFDELLKYADGKIEMSEIYHQAYSDKIPKEEIEEINEYMKSKNLVPTGGRDNHKPKFL